MTKDDAKGETEELGFLCHCGKAFTVKQKRTYLRHIKTIHKDNELKIGDPELLRFKGKANNRTAEKVHQPQVDNEVKNEGDATSDFTIEQSNKPEKTSSKDTTPKETGIYQDPETPIKNYSDYVVGKKFVVPPELDEDTGESDDEEWIEDGCHPISLYTKQFDHEVLKRDYSQDDLLKLRWIRETFKPAAMCPFTICSAEKCTDDEEDPPSPFRTWARMARHLIENHCISFPEWQCNSPNCKDETFIRRHEAVRHMMSAHRMAAKTARKAVSDGEKVKRVYMINDEPTSRDVPLAIMMQINNWAIPHGTKQQNDSKEKSEEMLSSGKQQEHVGTAETSKESMPSPVKRQKPVITTEKTEQPGSSPAGKQQEPVDSAEKSEEPWRSPAVKRQKPVITAEKTEQMVSSPAGKRQKPMDISTPVLSPKKRKISLDQAQEEPAVKPNVELPEENQEMRSDKQETAAVPGKMPEVKETAWDLNFVEKLVRDLVRVTEQHCGLLCEELARAKSDRTFWEKRCEKAEAGQKELLSKFFQAFHVDQRSWSGDITNLNLDRANGGWASMNHQSEPGLSSPNGLASISEEEMEMMLE